ncbi:MAG: hypothetical protein HC923_10080 [Myxococcales bacterium]|nr:hypothetical protein [Myxococcales bacterium]
MGQVIERESPVTREALREGLRRVDGFEGVTGTTSFLDGTEARKTVRILTIKDGIIREVKPADVPGPSGEASPEESPSP